MLGKPCQLATKIIPDARSSVAPVLPDGLSFALHILPRVGLGGFVRRSYAARKRFVATS